MDKHDFELLKREILYQGIFTLARYHVRHRNFDDSWSASYSREILERKPAAAILPYDPVLDRVVLIEQFRAGAIAHPDSPWLIEIVAGIFDKKETPEELVKREAIEEAGCEILDLDPITNYFVSPGGSTEYIHVFCGRVDASNVGGTFGLSNENEDIRAFTLSVDEAYQWFQEGKIANAPTIISLLWLQLNREWLKQLWQVK
jgi:ADP-ribose pyrophosphatase